MVDTRTATSLSTSSRSAVGSFAGHYSITHQTSQRSVKPSENLKRCSHLRKPKKVWASTSYLMLKNNEETATAVTWTMKRLPRLLPAQATMTRVAKRARPRKELLKETLRMRRMAQRCCLSQKVAVLNAAIPTTTKGKETGLLQNGVQCCLIRLLTTLTLLL